MAIRSRLLEAIGSCGRLLQVALDFTSLNDALRVARVIPRHGAVILEAGTPLIKSRGMQAVRLLRLLPGEHFVVADTKTMDTGALEVSLAAEAGADAVSVLAVAPEETIGEAVDKAREYGLAVYGDMIGHPDPLEAARTLRRLGVHIALLHIGVDVQRRLGLTASQLRDLIGRVAGEFQGPVAVAGGIKPEETGALASAGASIVIIGGGITRAGDPAAAAQRALEGLRPSCV